MRHTYTRTPTNKDVEVSIRVPIARNCLCNRTDEQENEITTAHISLVMVSVSGSCNDDDINENQGCYGGGYVEGGNGWMDGWMGRGFPNN